MGKKIRVVTFDSLDGTGKTTQLNLLAKRLKERNIPLHATKLLGGDGSCDFQKAFRTILLHPKFPKDQNELEERLFAVTCGEATRMVQVFLQENETGIALKDRGIASHFAYALAKSMAPSLVETIFRDLVNTNKDINRRYGAVDILLIPDDINWAQKRIKDRNAKEGVEYVERLENLDMQKNVLAAMKQIPFFSWARDINFEPISIKESDTIQDVQAKVDEVLAKYNL